MNERIKSTRLIGVDSKAGRRSRTGSTATMGITDRQAIELQDYYLAIDAGEKPTEGLIGVELRGIYAEDEQDEKKVEQMIENLDDALEVGEGHAIVEEGEDNE